jgi:hypothetical protein
MISDNIIAVILKTRCNSLETNTIMKPACFTMVQQVEPKLNTIYLGLEIWQTWYVFVTLVERHVRMPTPLRSE